MPIAHQPNVWCACDSGLVRSGKSAFGKWIEAVGAIGFLKSNNHWLINSKMRQLKIYRPNREVNILEYPKSLSGEDVLPGFVLDLHQFLSGVT